MPLTNDYIGNGRDDCDDNDSRRAQSIAYVIRRRGNYSNAEYSDNSPPPLDRE